MGTAKCASLGPEKKQGLATTRCRALEGISANYKGKGPGLKAEKGLGRKKSEVILRKIGSRPS